MCTFSLSLSLSLFVASLAKLKDESESDVAKKGLLSSLVHSEVSVQCCAVLLLKLQYYTNTLYLCAS